MFLYGQNPFSVPNVIQGAEQTVTESQWIHASMVFSGTSITTYYNAVNKDNLSLVVSPVTFTALSLGNRAAINADQAAKCEIDDLRIYNTALTAAQVKSIYNQQGVPGRGAGITQYIKSATGGNTVQDIGGYRIHTFTTVGTSTFTPATSGLVEVLVVAGGGGGGGCSANQSGGGGGAGELVYIPNSSVSGSVSVTVGAGGNGGTTTGVNGTNGGNSVFGSLTALGGGFGGTTNRNGNPGGSGGGSGRTAIGGASTATIGYGNAGGLSVGNISGTASGGGGGGATSVGQNAYDNNIRTPGGTGYTSSISGTGVIYATGGNGGARSLSSNGANGAANTGNGADGGDGNALTNGGAGGSGIVIVRYPISGPVNMTGTPLFTQLSTSATSSAVGAFSLRAVNGGTAKAVAVQVHPVVQWPPVAMTSNTTIISAQTYGNGTYTTVASSYNAGGGIYEAWRAFTNVSNWWRPSGATYDGTTGIFVGTTYVTVSGGVNYYGEWLQIQLPNKIRLVNYTLDQAPVIAGSQLNSTPLTFYVFGSNDSGTTWTLIDAQDVPVYTTQSFVVPSANAITTYNWFRLSVNKIPPSTTTLRVAKWILNGSADNYATGSATDFYADRLGNLLTAPVVGQSLASWLGGATGYVTTWYDQSGAGNHATQATAANQPIITKATKGPGYACVYTGNQWVSFGTLNTFTGTPFCISAVTTRTSNVSLNGITGWGDGFSGFNFAIFTLSATQDRFRSDFRKTTGLNASGAIPVYAAGEGALYPVCDYSSGFINRIYNKSSLLTTSGNGVDFLNTANTKTPSIGLAPASAPNCFYQGEIYEVIFFTKSLYDLDGTSTITQIYNNQVGIYGT
jgi:hypothetical protein